VIERRGSPRFVAKALQSLRLLSGMARRELQSNEAAEFIVLGFVDHTHAAAPVSRGGGNARLNFPFRTGFKSQLKLNSE
jgi:hypothetical protein